MNNFRKTYNPFLRGLRPKKFFGKRIDQLRKTIMLSDNREFNKEWRKLQRA